jgi:hypothetical protein
MNRMPLAIFAAALAGCATAPIETTVSVQPPCSFLRVEQAGKGIAPNAGVVTVARAPFDILYVGPGIEPSLHVSSKPALAEWLTRQGRAEIWLPLGLGMAASPGVIITDDKPRAWRDNEKRKAVSQVVHARYWPMVKEKVEARPLDVAVSAGTNTWWEPARGTSPRVYRVTTINDDPTARSKLETLHIVAFGETERIVAGTTNTPLLSRTRWNDCAVRFAK